MINSLKKAWSRTMYTYFVVYYKFDCINFQLKMTFALSFLIEFCTVGILINAGRYSDKQLRHQHRKKYASWSTLYMSKIKLKEIKYLRN